MNVLETRGERLATAVRVIGPAVFWLFMAALVWRGVEVVTEWRLRLW